MLHYLMSLDKSWHDYNESLIERGRILMEIGFIKSWNKEIRNMNEGKGAPFEYSQLHPFSSISNIAFLLPGRKPHRTAHYKGLS